MKRSRRIHVVMSKAAAAVQDDERTERAEIVEAEYRMKNTVVLTVSTMVIEPRRRIMCLEGRKDMSFNG